ncbi:MAG TPA: response regulator [Candidatus Hydrogenedentes bacterium]|nr:response regulator [Candidatus Hydrogenedentota bacterium]HNT89412.1 response regulator [Candidatus Hydrogenedentota bacterium]
MSAPLRVLIIDDEADNREVVAATFEAAGWETTTAENGEIGLILALREHPNLIILDVMMPGKDGFAVFKELRGDAQTQDIPVIMLTAVNTYELGVQHDEMSMSRTLGVRPPEAFLEKPLECDRLIALATEVAA